MAWEVPVGSAAVPLVGGCPTAWSCSLQHKGAHATIPTGVVITGRLTWVRGGCGINDWSPRVTGNHWGFFSPANFSVFAYVSHIHNSVHAEPQAFRPHLFPLALLQASCDAETKYLFSFPCKHRFLTCRGIGLPQWDPVAAPGVSLLRGRGCMPGPSPLSGADGLEKLPSFQVTRNSVLPQQLQALCSSSASVKLHLPGGASCSAHFLELSAFGNFFFFYNMVIFRHSSVNLN